MLMVGKRMWKLMFAANWMRESSRVSMTSGLSLRRWRLARHAVLEFEHARDGGAHAHQLHRRFGGELAHVVEPGHEPVDQLVHLAHALLRMALGLAGGLL